MSNQDYTVGGISGLLSSSTLVKHKKKKKRDNCADLFETQTLPPQKIRFKELKKPVHVSTKISKSESENDNKAGKNTKTHGKKSKQEKKTVSNEVAQQSGYCPPPGIIHEALLNKDEDASIYPDDLSCSDDNENVQPKQKRKATDKEANERTIFVGNLPLEMTKKSVKELFRKVGKIESVRIRSAVAPDISLPKKVAVIKKKFHPSVNRLNAYVVFRAAEDAQKALKKNGKKVGGHHIRVDLVGVSTEKTHDYKKSVFVGNLPFDINEDTVWKHFKQCGKIENVRLVRDAKTGIGKGFGYVLFESADSASLAQRLKDSELSGRKIRIERAVKKQKSKPQKSPMSNKKLGSKFTRPSNIAKGSSFKTLKDKPVGKKTKNAINAQRRMQIKNKSSKS